jgi:hypothetical protein
MVLGIHLFTLSQYELNPPFCKGTGLRIAFVIPTVKNQPASGQTGQT